MMEKTFIPVNYNHLKDVIFSKGYSVRSLCATYNLGIGRTTLYRHLENGMIRKDILTKIAEILEVSELALIGEERYYSIDVFVSSLSDKEKTYLLMKLFNNSK